MCLAMGNDDDIRELDLQALVDGEASSQAKASLMQRVRQSPDTLQELESLMYQKLLLKEWWKKFRMT